ncbi:hypothetical protein Tco_1320273 [Tanacetum coccineum]
MHRGRMRSTVTFNIISGVMVDDLASMLTCSSSFLVIMEYLVKVIKKARILELKRRNMKKTDYHIQYAVSIKEDTAYLCLHFTKDHEGNKINTPYPENPIFHIQAMEIKYSGRYRM